MYINATGSYIPEKRIGNHYFAMLNGVTDEWIAQRTGIRARSKARDTETSDSMGIRAVKDALPGLPYGIREVDLIVSASYTPYDTICTTAHRVQHEFGIKDTAAFHLSAACSSFVNALEVVEGYFAAGKASKALVLAAEKNSAYSDETDPKAGHLWGDAAAAFFLSRKRLSDRDAEVCDVHTRGLGFLPKAPDAVNLRPAQDGLTMREGRDVFQKACVYISENVFHILWKNGYGLEDLNYLIPHQANMRIIRTVARQLGLPEERCLHNIEEVGNTGSASSALVYAQNESIFKKDDLIILSVFGGGYSTGVCLIKY